MIVMEVACDVTAILGCQRVKRVTLRIIVKCLKVNEAAAEGVHVLGPTM